MTPNTSHDFRLSFTTDVNEIMVINVPRANSSRLPAQIADAMDAIINSGVVQSARGIPNARSLAELVVTTRSDINVFA